MGNHDISHKEFYSHPENVKDLIQGFVALDCVSDFDFSTLERENASFVTKENTERHDDIIWRLRYQDKWIYVYILIEFQSDVDDTMPVRIMSYISLLYLYLLANKNLEYWKEKKLPVVLPIVLYNGKDIWNVPKNIESMFKETYKELDRFIPKLSYYFIDEVHPEANEKDTVLDGLANSVVATMKLQRVASTDKFTEFLNELKEIIKNPDYKKKFITFMAFMRRFLSFVYDNPAFEQALTLEEIIKMTKTFRDYDRENDLEEGKKEGKLSAFYDMIKKGRITLEEAASDIGISVEQLLASFKEYNLFL